MILTNINYFIAKYILIQLKDEKLFTICICKVYQKKSLFWGRYTKFYRSKINFKNKKVLDFGCGNLLTSSTAKFFKEENGNLKNLYGFEVDEESKKY